MKLIDMLVEDGLNGWQWPEGVKCITQDNGSSIYKGVAFGYCKEPYLKKNIWLAANGTGHADVRVKRYDVVADDWSTAIITREQYESALAASKDCAHDWIYSEGRTASGYLCRKCGDYNGPESETKADDDGWIDWGGGECPVPCGTAVDVKHRCGAVSENQQAWPKHHKESDVVVNPFSNAGQAFWRHENSVVDIIAYRLHQPQEVTQSDDEADLNECIGQDAAPVWNGEGLPPVGCECEFISNDTYWGPVVVIGMDGDKVVIKPSGETYYGITPSEKQVFRPIRSEADKRRDEAVKAIMLTGWCQTAAEEIYDLIAAGKVPGMKLED